MSTISECELCGAKASKKAKVEGTVLDVCENCVKYGKEVKEVEYKRPVKKILRLDGEDQVMVKDFHKLIRHSREKRKLTQEDLAKKLNEKLSLIKRVEDGWHPSNKTIDKIEKFFNIKIREEAVELIHEQKQNAKSLTIGDVIEIG